MKAHTIIQSTIAALALAFIPNLHAQTNGAGGSKVNPEAKATDSTTAPKVYPNAEDLGSMNISITYEAFSLPIAKAGELQRKGLTDVELYKEFVSAGKLERLLVLRTRSGDRATLENVTNYIFPTEFTQPHFFCGDPKKTLNLPTPLPVAPTTFDKKDVGDTMECEPTLSPDAKSVDFQIGVTHVALARREKWGNGITELEQPQFETKRLATNVNASLGSPRLIGTLNPVFGNGLTDRAEQHVWFCFITATIAQNNAAPQKKAGR